MKKLTFSVLALRNGSTQAVVGSGNSCMSDSWMAWNPRIEDPSKPRPSSKTDWSNDETGTVKCCITPGRSQNRTSTISMPSSSMYFSSSSLFANIRPPWPRGPCGWVGDSTGCHRLCWARLGDAALHHCPRTYARAVSEGYLLCFIHVTAAAHHAARPSGAAHPPDSLE